jgi:hypothetical protein
VVPHLEYLKRLARTEPDHETAPSGTRVREAPQPRLAGNGLGAGVALLWNLVVRPAARRSNDHAFDDRHADWQHYFGLDVVHIDDPSLPHAMILRRDQRLAWRLWLEMLRELVLLGLSNRRTLARWRRAMPALTSRAHWIEYFENNGASLDAASEAPEKRSTVR